MAESNVPTSYTMVHAHIVVEVTYPWDRDGKELAEFLESQLTEFLLAGVDDGPRFTVHCWPEPAPMAFVVPEE